jgi:hypothetical protein
MADPKELTRLLEELRRVSSPLERLKMVTRAWRSLRRLDPAQRKALADQVGVADAADLIEKLAVGKAGLKPSMVQRALDSVGNRNVGDLRELVRDLRDPEERKKLLQRGLDVASESLAGPETDEIPVEEVVVKASPPAEHAPSPPPGPENDEPPVEATAAAPLREARPRKPQTPTPEQRDSKPVRDARPALLDRMSKEPMLTRRFRLFREHLDEARGWNARQLRDLLDLFPDGWAQRRVLDMLLREGIPESLNKAIFLIEQLDSPVARRWCVKTLLRERELGDDERKLLVERHELAGDFGRMA